MAPEAIAEIRPPGFKQPDLARQRVPEEGDQVWAGRAIRHVGLDTPDLPRRENVGADILQKCGVEGGGLLAVSGGKSRVWCAPARTLLP